MLRLQFLVLRANSIRFLSKNALIIRRDFSKSAITFNNLKEKTITQPIKPKSHKPKTLEELMVESKENEKLKALQSTQSENDSTTTKGKQSALDIVNTGPKIPENWRKMNIPEWQRQRFALIEKFTGASWAPKKKISREDMTSVRILKEKLPDMTTKELSEHFRISPEAIRRILKSKWTPTQSEEDNLHERWKKRGVRVKELIKTQSEGETKTPKIMISSTREYSDVKYSKNGKFFKREKKVVDEGSKERLHTRDSKGLRKMKF